MGGGGSASTGDPVRGLSERELEVLDLVDSLEGIEPFSPAQEAAAQGLLRRGLLVRVDPQAEPGLGDDATPLGRFVASICRNLG